MLVPQVALAIKLEGDARHSEGAAAAELLAVAADVWAHSIRPMHREQESYHEGQVHAIVTWQQLDALTTLESQTPDICTAPRVHLGCLYVCRRSPARWQAWAAST